ncbi:MAG: aldehyde dehydrogenase family protein [Calditrichaeota bacterium]|nr:MAG: aldehyde dehydrogenase family protein [Calditrichota bacterium]MBL1205113.1 aldehyde dehydrogenase family protein [Calditrichota bacterium]NOG44943.1 aldehyde dehydrogenase family protein [Calditrichota bacterium]
MLKEKYPFYLCGKAIYANKDLAVSDKFTGKIVSHVALANKKHIETAIESAVVAEQAMKDLAAYKRQEILYHCVERFKQRFDELAEGLCIEAGKPIKDSRGEVTRLIDTFRVAAEEATRMYGEVLPMDISERATNYSAMWKRVPIGACSFITPFNFPLNLVAHKVAPAIAAGCPFVLKPSEITPIGALIIGEILAETDLPDGAFSILPTLREDAAPFAEDPRLKLLSFTGSPKVGWMLKSKAGRKKVQLELGGNAACVLDNDTNIDDAIQRIIFGAFYQSGQSCVSVQRILIHESIYDSFKINFVSQVNKLKMGNPKNEDVLIGPIISENEAKRIEEWIKNSINDAADLLCGGSRTGNMVEATVLENVKPTADVYCREIFGPVAILKKFNDFDEALSEVNNSEFGLQAGVFTRDIYKAQKAWDKLQVGSVIINDVPSWRVDHMPYGGVKGSGLGREGIRFAMQEMTEIKQMVIRKI